MASELPDVWVWLVGDPPGVRDAFDSDLHPGLLTRYVPASRIAELEKALALAEQQRDEYRRDAERYRGLVTHMKHVDLRMDLDDGTLTKVTIKFDVATPCKREDGFDETIDEFCARAAAIDAARSEGQKA